MSEVILYLGMFLQHYESEELPEMKAPDFCVQ